MALWISDTTRTRKLRSSMQSAVSINPEGECSDNDGEPDELEVAPTGLVFGEVHFMLTFFTVHTKQCNSKPTSLLSRSPCPPPMLSTAYSGAMQPRVLRRLRRR